MAYYALYEDDENQIVVELTKKEVVAPPDHIEDEISNYRRVSEVFEANSPDHAWKVVDDVEYLGDE